MTVGDRIRQVRIEKDITQQELADCAGVSKQAVYKYENNIVTNIPMDKLSLIASKLGVTPCFLMGWEDNNSVPEVPDTIKAALQQEDGKVAEIMELFLNLPADKQQEALSYLRYLSASADKRATLPGRHPTGLLPAQRFWNNLPISCAGIPFPVRLLPEAAQI